jgi:excisionase family DNA binding protein
MNCSEILEHLVAYLDGELPSDRSSEVEAHLGSCGACRGEAEEMRSLSALARSQAPLEPSPTWDLALGRKLDALKWWRLNEEVTDLRQTVAEMRAAIRDLQDAARPQAEEPLMTVDEVAAYLRMPREQIYSTLDELPYVEMSYELRFRKSSIDEWLERHEHRPAPDDTLWSDWIDGKLPHFSS